MDRWADATPKARQLATILIVDDDGSSRSSLGELLQDAYVVIMASSGAEALALAARHVPDLILLDVVMPMMNGYEVLRRLKDDPYTAGIGVIFVTGLEHPAAEARGLLLGGLDYICKPFDPPVVCARITSHLRSVRQRQRLEEMANIDGLTGIANRRYFDDVLATECRRARRAGHPLSVAMVDVDYFKQYNDHYGHVAGDAALRSLAQVLRDGSKRPGDLAARYGGEEFAIMLVDAAAPDALRVMEALCSAVRALGISHEKSSVATRLTVSAGVASGLPAEDRFCPEWLVQAADRCLYQAKAAGRNCVVGAPQ